MADTSPVTVDKNGRVVELFDPSKARRLEDAVREQLQISQREVGNILERAQRDHKAWVDKIWQANRDQIDSVVAATVRQIAPSLIVELLAQKITQEALERCVEQIMGDGEIRALTKAVGALAKALNIKLK